MRDLIALAKRAGQEAYAVGHDEILDEDVKRAVDFFDPCGPTAQVEMFQPWPPQPLPLLELPLAPPVPPLPLLALVLLALLPPFPLLELALLLPHMLECPEHSHSHLVAQHRRRWW